MRQFDWKLQSGFNHNEYIKRAQSKGKLKTKTEIQDFLALAIAGEAGELANIFKKRMRGDDFSFDKAKDELADVYIYVHHLANELGIDLEDAAYDKVGIVTQRLKESK